MDVRLIVRRF